MPGALTLDASLLRFAQGPSRVGELTDVDRGAVCLCRTAVEPVAGATCSGLGDRLERPKLLVMTSQARGAYRQNRHPRPGERRVERVTLPLALWPDCAR